MDTIVVYSASNSNRLRYVLDWLLKERLHISYTITHSEQEATQHPFFIAYGKHFPNSLSIPDTGLLWEKEIKKIAPKTGNWNEVPTLFDQPEGFTLPFDFLSAAFFLLSRYEEYGETQRDKHGRYPAASSILYKQGWLMRPLLDEWVSAFGKQLQQHIQIAANHFLFQPTYDIDMAYSHLHKGVGRIVGAYMRALLKFDVRQISERTQVLKKKQKDPFDSFRWLRQLHKQYDYKPLYFILAAARTTAYDKNIPPQHPAMMRVIKNLVKEGNFGIHPSYYSGQKDVLAQEKSTLERVAGRSTYISRQHYIKVKLPDTYRLLLANHIVSDYSMGYGSHLGFRAATGNCFLWFDIEKDTVTKLRVYPFCFMDTTAHYEARLSASEAFEKLHAMSKLLEKTGSTLITVFHNFSLGTSGEWKGWRQAYEHFLEEKTSHHTDEVTLH